MDLPMAATSLMPCSAGRYLVATCQDGSAVLYNMVDLLVQGRWAMGGAGPVGPAR